MQSIIQVVENSDRFHVSENGVPVYTFLFKLKDEIGVSKSFAQMNANAEAYKLAVKRYKGKHKIVFLEQVTK